MIFFFFFFLLTVLTFFLFLVINTVLAYFKRSWFEFAMMSRLMVVFNFFWSSTVMYSSFSLC